MLAIHSHIGKIISCAAATACFVDSALLVDFAHGEWRNCEWQQKYCGEAGPAIDDIRAGML